MDDQTHWTDADRDTMPDECHLCLTKGVPLTNHSRDYGGYQGPHWLCGLCRHTAAASMRGAGNWPNHSESVMVVGDIAAMLHAAGLTPGAVETDD